MKDKVQEMENDYLKMFTYGGKLQNSFWQNVGKTAFPQAVYFKGMKAYDEMMKRTEDILNGRGKSDK